ncbi:DUF5696 domain-containing protein [Paenibacillus xylanexedens]|uniref:DUF5696 domain-containing protein n=1 Tax=Paenibacillus xylanexedens TaxID=528191 RepID=UPI0034D97B4B
MELEGLCLGDLGEVLSSDYGDSGVIDRERGKKIVEEEFEKLEEIYRNMMV